MTGLPVKINICSVYTWFPPISFNRKDTEVNKHTKLLSALGLRMCHIHQVVIECVHSLLFPWTSMPLYWYYLEDKQTNKPLGGSSQNDFQFLENENCSRQRGQCLRFGNSAQSKKDCWIKHHLGKKCSIKWHKDGIIAQEKNLHIVLNVTKQLQFRAKIVQDFQESEAPKSHQVWGNQWYLEQKVIFLSLGCVCIASNPLWKETWSCCLHLFLQQQKGEGELNTSLLPLGAGLMEHRCTYPHQGCLPCQTWTERI